MKKEKLIAQAKKIHLLTNEDVLDRLVTEGNKINQKIDLLKSIDVSNVEPMTRISQPTSFLREDEVLESFSKEKLLKNSKHTEGDYIVLKKEVEHD